MLELSPTAPAAAASRTGENRAPEPDVIRPAPVAYIMSRFPKLSETFILREMLEMERQGQPIIVLPLLTVQQPTHHPEAEPLMARAQYTPFISRPIIAANLHYLRRRPRAYLATLWRALRGNFGSANLFGGAIGIFPKSVYFARLVKSQGIRHVHAHYATHPALAAMIISELTGVTFSFTAHGHDLYLLTRMIGEKMQLASFVVTISEFNKQHLLKLCPELPPEKIKIIHCGIQLDRYGAQTSRSPERKTDRAFTILCVASLERHKGHEYLVKACALLKNKLGNFRCLLAGEGEERPRLEKLIAELGLRDVVHLLGGQAQQRVAALLAEADLFALASTRDALPVVLMEAMASRLPVVATRIYGIPELVEDGVTGLLVPPANEQALADAIAHLHEHEPLRREMGERGRRKVSSAFELGANVRTLQSLFDSHDDAGHWKTEIAQSIRANAGTWFPEFDGSEIDLRFHPRGGGADSQVYEIALHSRDKCSRSLIAKLHRVTPGLSHDVHQMAEREHRALSLLWENFSRHSTRFRVPRPIDHMPRLAAVLMEKCDGSAFHRTLRWARFFARPERLREQARACGEWLALFHRITSRDGNVSDVYARITLAFACDLRSCAQRGLGADLVSRLTSMFEEKAKLAFRGGDEIVGHHGDFAPYNVFLAGDTVSVIDFEGIEPGLRGEDLCHFLCTIETMPRYHVGRGLARLLTLSFLEGYGVPLERSQMEVFMIASMVKIVAYSPALGNCRRNELDFYREWLETRLRNEPTG